MTRTQKSAWRRHQQQCKAIYQTVKQLTKLRDKLRSQLDQLEALQLHDKLQDCEPALEEARDLLVEGLKAATEVADTISEVV